MGSRPLLYSKMLMGSVDLQNFGQFSTSEKFDQALALFHIGSERYSPRKLTFGVAIDFYWSVEHFGEGVHFEVVAVGVRSTFPGNVTIERFRHVLREVIRVLRYVIHAALTDNVMHLLVAVHLIGHRSEETRTVFVHFLDDETLLLLENFLEAFLLLQSNNGGFQSRFGKYFIRATINSR